MAIYNRKAAESQEGSCNKMKWNTVIILDRSASMIGEPTKKLNGAMKAFFDESTTDMKAIDRVDLCVIDFGTDATLNLDWTPLAKVNSDTVISDANMGCTNYEDAITLALKQVDAKRARDKALGIPRSPPQIFFITDGGPTCDITTSVNEITARLAERDSSGNRKFSFYPIYTGNVGDSAVTTLARYNNVIVADPLAYGEIFHFVHDSVKACSESEEGDKISVTVPPGLQVVNLN